MIPPAELRDPEFRGLLASARRVLQDRLVRGVATPRERTGRSRAALPDERTLAAVRAGLGSISGVPCRGPDGGPLDSSPTGLEWGYQRIRNHAQLALTILLAVTDEAPAVAHHLWFEVRRASLGFFRVLVPCCRVNMVKGGGRRMEGAISSPSVTCLSGDVPRGGVILHPPSVRPCHHVARTTAPHYYRRFGVDGAISGWPSRANSMLKASPQSA